MPYPPMTPIETILDAAFRAGATRIYDAWNAVVIYVPEEHWVVVAERLALALKP